MPIVKNLYLLFFISIYQISFCQIKKDTLFILFDSNLGDVKIENSELINFKLDNKDILQKRHILNFTYNRGDLKKNVCFSNYKSKLITGLNATQKVDTYLNAKAIECEKISKQNEHCKLFRNPAVYYYNNYFETIYIYEKINETDGVLYKVIWNWSIR